MSIELVGFENLPNAYIKEISIFDYKANQIEMKVIIRVHDLEDGSVWFDTSETLSKLLRIGLIISTDENQSQQINSGESKPVQLISMSRAIPSANKTNDNLVFEASFRKIIPANTKHLNLYSLCFIDKVQVLEKFGFSMGQDYYGPIKSEKVFNNSNITSNTDVFIQDNGQYWSGPMHQHRGKYMAGSYHTLTPHTMLRKITIPNVKIKDFRGMKGKRSESVDST